MFVLGAQEPRLPRFPRWQLPQPRLLRSLHERWGTASVDRLPVRYRYIGSLLMYSWRLTHLWVARRCPHSARHCPPSARHCPPSARHCPPSACDCPPSARHCPPSARHCLPLATLWPITCRPFLVVVIYVEDNDFAVYIRLLWKLDMEISNN